jgi:hypothetical protein
MNFKTLSKKPIVALALIAFMVMPMLLVSTTNAAGTATGSMELVDQATGEKVLSYGPAPSPIGTVITLDLKIINGHNIFGWGLDTLTWNSSVLRCDDVQEGDYMKPGNTFFLPPVIASGSLNGGISVSATAQRYATKVNGTAATLIFTVIGYGNTGFTIGGAKLLDSASDSGTPVSVTGTSVSVIAPVAQLALYNHATGTSTVTIDSASNPIGSEFTLDLNITDASGVWGWSIGVEWNPAVLLCTDVTEGTYLNGGNFSNSLFVVGFVDNNAGIIRSGIVDALLAYTSASATSGNLARLTFHVIGFGTGSTDIVLTPGVPSTLSAAQPPHAMIDSTLVNATYEWAPQIAIHPQAVITTPDSPYGFNDSKVYTNYEITVDGSSSIGGTDQEPPNSLCPITTWAWHIQLVDGTILNFANQTQVHLTSAQVGSNPGIIHVTLTVTAPDTNFYSAPTYVSTNSITRNIEVVLPYVGGILDIYTNKGGQGWHANSDAYAPQEQVNLTAYLTYNGAPVVGKLVTFTYTTTVPGLTPYSPIPKHGVATTK